MADRVMIEPLGWGAVLRPSTLASSDGDSYATLPENTAATLVDLAGNPVITARSDLVYANSTGSTTVALATNERGAFDGWVPPGTYILTIDGDPKQVEAPASLPGTTYKGTWNASTNSPTLADGTGNDGDFYVVSVAAVRNLGAGSLTWGVNDYVVYDGGVWTKVAGITAPNLGTIFSGRHVGAISSLVLGQYTLHSRIIPIPAPCTLTGLGLENAATVNGNLKVYAFAAGTGTITAASASTAQAGTSAMQQIAFASTLAVSAGLLGIGVISDSASATAFAATDLSKYSRVGNGSFTLGASITPPPGVGTTVAPVVYTY